jgi:hypothetical protein
MCQGVPGADETSGGVLLEGGADACNTPVAVGAIVVALVEVAGIIGLFEATVYGFATK